MLRASAFLALALFACAGSGAAPVVPPAPTAPDDSAAPVGPAASASAPAASADPLPPEPPSLLSIAMASGPACRVSATHWETRTTGHVAVNEGDVMGGYATYNPVELRVAPEGPAFALAFSGWDAKLAIGTSRDSTFELTSADRTEARPRRGPLTLRGFVAPDVALVVPKTPLVLAGYVAPGRSGRMAVRAATGDRVTVASPTPIAVDTAGALPTAGVACDALALSPTDGFDTLHAALPSVPSVYSLPIVCVRPEHGLPFSLEASGAPVGHIVPSPDATQNLRRRASRWPRALRVVRRGRRRVRLRVGQRGRAGVQRAVEPCRPAGRRPPRPRSDRAGEGAEGTFDVSPRRHGGPQVPRPRSRRRQRAHPARRRALRRRHPRARARCHRRSRRGLRLPSRRDRGPALRARSRGPDRHPRSRISPRATSKGTPGRGDGPSGIPASGVHAPPS